MADTQQVWLAWLGMVWSQNPPRAAVTARLEASRLDRALLATTARAAAAARQQAKPGTGLKVLAGLFGMAPQQAFDLELQAFSAEAFHRTLALVAEHGGDPPAPAGLAANAEGVLRGLLDPSIVLADAGPDLGAVLEGLERVVELARQANADPRPLLAAFAMVLAALALPREQLAVLAAEAGQAVPPPPLGFGAGRDTGGPPGSAPDAGGEFASLLAQAERVGQSDPNLREDLLIRALETAARTASPDDDYTAMNQLFLSAQMAGLGEQALRAAAGRVTALVREGQSGDQLAGLADLVVKQAVAKGLVEEVGLPLAEAVETLLQGTLQPITRTLVGTTAADAWMRLGRPDRADVVLDRLERTELTPDGTLQVARARANFLYDTFDRHAATDVLMAALDRTPQAAPAERQTSIGTLLTVWPADRSGIEEWVEQATALLRAIEEPLRSLTRLNLLMVVRRSAPELAEKIGADLDLDELRRMVPQYASWLDETEAFLKEPVLEASRQMDRPMATAPIPDVALHGAAPSSAAGLGLARRFGEAADAALREAQDSLSRGFRIHGFDNLATAGKFFQMEGQNERGLEAFEQAFALFEHDVVYLPRASMVVRWLADWPEVYTRAALAALETGDALRAVRFAETGRARAIGNRMGPSARSRPQAAPADLWDRYVRAWRLAVARAANELVERPGADGERREAEARELDDLRKQLLATPGVEAEQLVPLAEPGDPSTTVARLSSSSRPTAVVYSIRLDDTTLRLVRLTSTGGAEIPLPTADQSRILQACDRYVAQLREHPKRIEQLVEELSETLMAEVGAPLGGALERGLDGLSDGRLVWVPQGSLVAVPVAACPLGAGTVADRLAVMVTPSLGMARAAIEPDIATAPRPVALKGRVEGKQASTDGGGALLAVIAEEPVAERVPASLEDFNASVAHASLLQVTCHGIYDWEDPLRSYLQLGFDLPVGELFDRASLASDSFVVFGACDSGTVAQNPINEAVGIPVGMLVAGARGVVGACWPVRQTAAAGICLRFFEELEAGSASPEALRRAGTWLRDSTLGEVGQALAQAGHPLGAVIQKAPASWRTERSFAKPSLWASHVHWGGGWQRGLPPGASGAG